MFFFFTGKKEGKSVFTNNFGFGVEIVISLEFGRIIV